MVCALYLCVCLCLLSQRRFTGVVKPLSTAPPRRGIVGPWPGRRSCSRYLDDLEQQAAALYDAERAPELADRGRAEYQQVTLASRLMASVDLEVTLELTGVGAVSGRLERVADGWCLVLSGHGQDWVVRTPRSPRRTAPRSGRCPRWPGQSSPGSGSARRCAGSPTAASLLRCTCSTAAGTTASYAGSGSGLRRGCVVGRGRRACSSLRRRFDCSSPRRRSRRR